MSDQERRMACEHGDPASPIWLIGDSNPAGWEHVLDYPLDARHPTRHNIWTPVLDAIQEKVYQDKGLRLDVTRLYVRNAIQNAQKKAEALRPGYVLPDELARTRNLIIEHRPEIVITFGAFSYEYCRRAIESDPHPQNYWTVERLKTAFDESFDKPGVALVPLLHAVIARRSFLQCHETFSDKETPNYFAYTGKEIAKWLLKNREQLDVWCPIPRAVSRD